MRQTIFAICDRAVSFVIALRFTGAIVTPVNVSITYTIANFTVADVSTGPCTVLYS